MYRYLTLIEFTSEGIRNIQQSVERETEFSQWVADAGGHVIGAYWGVGATDGAIVFEVPTEGAAASILVKLGAKGFVRTKTTRVYTAEEFKGIVG